MLGGGEEPERDGPQRLPGLRAVDAHPWVGAQPSREPVAAREQFLAGVDLILAGIGTLR